MLGGGGGGAKAILANLKVLVAITMVTGFSSLIEPHGRVELTDQEQGRGYLTSAIIYFAKLTTTSQCVQEKLTCLANYSLAKNSIAVVTW